MDNIADCISAIVPVKYQALSALALAVLSNTTLITRGYHALTQGGGLVGIFRAVFFGTNTSKEVKADIAALKTAAITGDTQFITNPDGTKKP